MKRPVIVVAIILVLAVGGVSPTANSEAGRFKDSAVTPRSQPRPPSEFSSGPSTR